MGNVPQEKGGEKSIEIREKFQKNPFFRFLDEWMYASGLIDIAASNLSRGLLSFLKIR